MTKKAQLKHLLLDVNFKDKPKVLELEYSFSPLARLLYIDMLSAMSAATDGMISLATISMLARRISFENLENFLSFLIENEMISKKANLYTNSRVQKDQESLYVKRENIKERVTRYRGVTNALQTRYPDTDTVTDTDNDLDNNKNSQVKKTEPKIDYMSLPDFPDVKITEPQHQLLFNKFNKMGFPDNAIDEALEILQGYLINNPKKRKQYKSHYHVLIGWVFDRMLEKRGKSNQGSGLDAISQAKRERFANLKAKMGM